MTRTAACIRKKGARRLTASMRSNSSGEVSSSVPLSVMPAALTGLDSTTVNVSFASTSRSPVIETLAVPVRLPAGIVTVPVIAV